MAEEIDMEKKRRTELSGRGDEEREKSDNFVNIKKRSWDKGVMGLIFTYFPLLHAVRIHWPWFDYQRRHELDSDTYRFVPTILDVPYYM